MFHLASSLYTQYTKREQYNILILGLDNAGKTTFLEHIKLLYPSTTANDSKKPKHSNQEAQDGEAIRTTSDIIKSKRILPTVGQNTTTIKFESSIETHLSSQFKNINLKFWDLGGQKSLRNMWSRYFKQCHGIIFIIDSTDTERFQECYDTLIDIAHDESWIDENNGDATVNVPILMLANKQDLPQAVDLVSLKTGVFIKLVSELEATDSKLLSVSVLENQGLKESLEWLVTRLIYNKTNRMPEYK
ncbi:uncharacterized protein SPAPADRAFT_53557 [Spathaspora passalidarum NRRL Y-27907]|uniref:ADP-ribosylation factor-like protein 3 n=1 Tax=Spathaspora passalidarum (strain NRRL Y-27907 / 11-Y1) TaxID=619300 RepID=G3AGB3_SPAPN|nr:uncharacterized protein SPAPADRAFT_53557 [Spathaspora passalidarum NRRL Y-27907]EGW35252.1 hypothetical protein SPAPADRAFT_53557 [Spathaspora passalidarum NRRL Y-27907]